MLKILEHQIQGASEDLDTLNTQCTSTDQKITRLEKEFDNEQARIEIDKARRQTEMVERDVEIALKEANEMHSTVNQDPYINDVIVDNELLLTEVDALYQKTRKSHNIREDLDFDDDIDSEEIDELYTNVEKR